MSVFIGYPSFMAYQMMKGKKDNNDGFPSIQVLLMSRWLLILYGQIRRVMAMIYS